MGDPLTYPKLRWPIDIRLERLEGKEVLLLSCPLGISQNPLLLVPAVGPVLSCFEGNLSIHDIAQRFASYGLKEEVVKELVALLDKNLFLASPKFFAAEQLIKDEFRLSPVRAPALAGGAYSAVPADLQREIDGYLKISDGLLPTAQGEMLGLVSPHIDYRRGGPCYGIAYSKLKSEQHDLYIVMGTSHQYSRKLFHLTRKHFPTPLGNNQTDVNFVDRLAARYGTERSFADEFLHRKEHSLELQLPFIHRLKQASEIVPILVGGFHHMLTSGKFPESFEEYDQFATALADGIRAETARGRRVCIVAGVDMAHVGKSFGDDKPLTPEFMEHVRQRDLMYLQTIKEQDAHELFSHIAEDEDARRICGFPTMYTVLDVFKRLGMKYTASVYDYRQAVDYPRECAVTFAGVGLYSPATPTT